MESIKISIFDIFAYLLPGLIVLLAICMLFNPSIVKLINLAQSFKNIDLSTGIVTLIAAYVIGHAVDNLGSTLYNRVGCKIWGNPYPKEKHPTLSHAQQRALIRQYSQENYSYLQTWKLLKNMSHNLSFASLVIVIASIIQLIRFHSFDWLFLMVLSLSFVLLLLYRAYVYDTWHYKELLETVQVLGLERKVALVSEVSKAKE